MEQTWQIFLLERIVWRLYGDSVEGYIFYREFMVKLSWRLSRAFHVAWQIFLLERIVWRLYGDSVEGDIFYREFIVKLAWRLSRVFM